MFSLFTALAALAVQAPAATTPHTLQNLPGTTVQYYDVAGRESDDIQKSLSAILKAPAPNTAAQVYTWSAGVSINKRTVGTTCTVTEAKATLKGNVYLPRLAEEQKVDKEVRDSFNGYEKGLEKTANDNLWFVAERLPAVEQSLVGKPCDSVQGVWNQAMENLIQQQKAFNAQNAKRK
ncbi:putative secreted Zn-dependent protease [Sphingomonas sp. F9_3S_D5_B_2]|jgi:predicted secreted Zn-dependent protease